MEIQPPNPIIIPKNHISIFLAGSIEMGLAEDWQRMVINACSTNNIAFLNPRRTDWDSSWEQKISNPKFKEQVVWELSGLEQAEIIVVYLDPNTKSPISLMELGLHAKKQNIIVCCPEGFYRKGNIDIVCERYDIKLVETIGEIIEYINWKTMR